MAPSIGIKYEPFKYSEQDLPPKHAKCHRTSFFGIRRSCRGLVKSRQCWLWTKMRGTVRNTGEELDSWACKDHWNHIFLLDQLAEQAEINRNLGFVLEGIERLLNYIGLPTLGKK